jgi:hypothetical protein
MALVPAGFAVGTVEFIWFCRDIDGRQHAWSHHGGYLELRPKSGEWPDNEDLFGCLYPNAQVPRGPTIQF